MNAAGENPRLHRRAIRPRPQHPFAVDAAVKTRQQSPPLAVVADDAGQPGTAAERGDVVRRVASAARHDFRGVVLEDQHRRFARDSLDVAVDELVRDQVADDEHAPARETVDEPEQALSALGLAGLRMYGSRNEHQDLRIQLAAAIKLSTIASASSGGRGCASSVKPYPVRTSTPRAPTQRASSTSSHRSPTTNDREGSASSSRMARSTSPRDGFRQSHAIAYSFTLPSGWCGQ